MIATTTTTTTTMHQQVTRWIDDHFALRLSTAEEAALRTHLPGCASCRARYERHLLLARLDPRAPTPQQRLSRGLGLRLAAPRRLWGSPVLVAAALAAVMLVMVVRGRQAEHPAMDGFGARGNGTAEQAFLWVYQVSDGTPPRLAGTRLAAGEDIAFAYANPAGKKYLSVFAVDEHGHVYWYYPAWPAGASPPLAMPATAGAGPHELPEAVRHDFDGHHLDMYALFADEPLDVQALERWVVPGTGGATVTVPEGAWVARRTFEVGP